MTPALRRPLAAGLTALLLLLSACASAPGLGDLGPVRTPTNFRGPAAWPDTISRVAVLPAHDASGRLTAEFTAAHDATWFRALTATQRAEFVAIPRATLSAWTGQTSLDSTTPLPHDLLARIATRTGTQAVMFLDLTHVTPYPPLKLAFRTRLVTVADGATLWMADELFDASDSATARGARREARANATGAGDPTSSMLQSPARFSAHAFGAVAALLPPRIAPPPPATETGPQTPAGNNSSSLPAKKYPNRVDSITR